MRLLAIDTATAGCSVAVWDDGVASARRAEMSRGQAEALLPMAALAMAEAGLGYGDLDAVAVTVGPGAFTGLRIGLAAARGLGLALSRPVVGVTTTEALAHAVPEPERAQADLVLAVLDSRRGDLFVQGFDRDLAPLFAPTAVKARDLAALLPEGTIVVVGDTAHAAVRALSDDGRQAILSSASGIPDAAVVAAIAARRPIDPPPPRPVPLYLRPPDATPAKNGGRLRP